jgi:hypothetical protein
MRSGIMKVIADGSSRVERLSEPATGSFFAPAGSEEH